MTEDVPDAEPRSVPADPARPGTGPNDLTPPEWRRTALIVWGLIGLVFAGGVGVMALTWREADLPRLPEAPDLSFDLPEWDSVFEGDPGRRSPGGQGDPPPDMRVSDASPARAVGRSDKPVEDEGGRNR